MNNQPTIQRDSDAWIFQTWVAFVASVIMLSLGIYFAPIDLIIKGYFGMGLLFVISSTFTLAKTIRDKHEADKIINRVTSAKTEKLLYDYELKDALGNSRAS